MLFRSKRDLHGIAFIEYPLTEAVVNQKNIPTSVSYQQNGAVVKSFELAQSYPNPFSLKEVTRESNSVMIAYRLNNEYRVTLTIYDLLGRQIKTLVNRAEPRGDYNVLWDGANLRGEKVTAGTYFYRIEAGGIAEVKKLILLK